MFYNNNNFKNTYVKKNYIYFLLDAGLKFGKRKQTSFFFQVWFFFSFFFSLFCFLFVVIYFLIFF